MLAGRAQPEVGSAWKWSFDPVKVCRALPFARGTPTSGAKAAAAAGTVLSKRGAQEKPSAVPAERGTVAVPGAGCAGAGRGRGTSGQRGVGGGRRRWWLLPGRALCVHIHQENCFSLLDSKGKFVMRKKWQV